MTHSEQGGRGAGRDFDSVVTHTKLAGSNAVACTVIRITKPAKQPHFLGQWDNPKKMQ